MSSLAWEIEHGGSTDRWAEGYDPWGPGDPGDISDAWNDIDGLFDDGASQASGFTGASDTEWDRVDSDDEVTE